MQILGLFVFKEAMFKSNIVAIIAYLLASTALGMEVILGTGLVKSPLFDGAFSDIGVGTGAAVFMCLTDESVYNTYANDSAGLYSAWQNGDFDSEQYQYLGNTDQLSSQREYVIDNYPTVDSGEMFYAIAVATFESAEYSRSFYIARAVSKKFTSDPDLFPCYITKLVSGADSWSVVPEPTTAMLFVMGLATLCIRRKFPR